MKAFTSSFPAHTSATSSWMVLWTCWDTSYQNYYSVGEKSLNVPLGSLYYPAFDHNEQDSIVVTTAAKLNRKRPIDPPPQPEQEAKISKPSSKAASPAAPAVEPAPSASAAAAPEFPPRPPGLPADNADVPEPMVPPAPKGKGKGKERHGWMLKCAQLMQAYEDQNWGECNRLINEWLGSSFVFCVLGFCCCYLEVQTHMYVYSTLRKGQIYSNPLLSFFCKVLWLCIHAEPHVPEGQGQGLVRGLHGPLFFACVL